jgi:F0F1-type ATP synthase membrane subunit b/b'
LKAESDEAEALVLTAETLYKECSERVSKLKEKVSEIDRELKPAREKVSALIQDNISVIDVKIGSINERLKQISRLAKNFAHQKNLDKEVDGLNRKLEPIVSRNRDLASGLDYENRSSVLEDGMNEYLTKLNKLRPSTWKHSAVEIYLSQSTAAFRVGHRRWNVSLGGTNSLYYLMAYHYGLISMTNHPCSRFPGFLMIDYPGEFAGVKIGNADDFTIQPFIDLLAKPDYQKCQAIFTGATFEGLKNVNRIELKEPYIT